MNIDFKRLGGEVVSAAAVFAVISGLFMGIVKLTGGSFPPWATPADVDGKINGHECKDYNDRFGRAQIAIQRNANDQTARDLFNSSLDKITEIPMCMPNVLPSLPPLQIRNP